GVGKSVILKMLIGLIPVDRGSIVFDGVDIAKIKERQLHDIRRRIAYLFQGAALFDSLDVGENVAYGLREQFWNTMSEADIRQRALQLTSVVVTHDMGTAFSVSDRLAMIAKGRILLAASKEEFKSTRDPYVRDFIEGIAPESEDVAALLA